MTNKPKKMPIDNSEFYKHTDSPARDVVFNAIVKRYGVKGNAWEKSDGVVWGGAIYVVSSYFGYMLIVALLWWLLSATIRLQGDTHAILLMLILMFIQLLRMNATLRKIDKDISK